MPCGHMAVAVVSQFYLCEGDPNCIGRMRCPLCKTTMVEAVSGPGILPDSWRCLPHGHVWLWR